MSKTDVASWDTTPANNTDVDGVNIAENCPAAGLNNALRAIMAQIKSGFSTASDILAGTSLYRFVSPKSLVDACAWYALTDASTITVDQNNGLNFTVAVGASGRTIANMSNAKIGTGGFIEVVNTAGGSKTLSWGTDYELPTGIGNPTTLSTGTGAVDVFSYVVRASGRIFVFGAKNLA